MKKIIVLIALFSILGTAITVQASTFESYYSFEEGWNLVYGFSNPDQLSGGDIVPENIKAIYILKQPTQEFVRVYPKPETTKLKGIDDSYYEKTASFVYSDKTGRSEYMFEEPLPPQYWNEHVIYKGWNLIGLSNHMVEGQDYPDLTLEDIEGTCNFEKVYYFFDGGWRKFDMPEMDSTLLLKGLLVKVSNNCVLGLNVKGDSNLIPPPIPNY